jgi:hypothetical protein
VKNVSAYCELLESTFANSSVQNLELSVENEDSAICVRLINALRFLSILLMFIGVMIDDLRNLLLPELLTHFIETAAWKVCICAVSISQWPKRASRTSTMRN